jgi:hypothetical protein
MQPIEFRAPWSRQLKIVTAIGAGIYVALMWIGAMLSPHLDGVVRWVLAGIPLLILCAFASTLVRGYTLTQDELLIKHLGRIQRIPLNTIDAVEGNALALRGAIPLWANYGFFAYTGWYWSRSVGIVRAYASDPSRAIILRCGRRKVVITPHDPQQFIMRARTLLKTAAFKV